jgi:hypothetical protein
VRIVVPNCALAVMCAVPLLHTFFKPCAWVSSQKSLTGLFLHTLCALQVVFMTGTRVQLLDRVRYRVVDCDASYEPFHVPPAAVAASCARTSEVKRKPTRESALVADDALSLPILPLHASGLSEVYCIPPASPRLTIHGIESHMKASNEKSLKEYHVAFLCFSALQIGAAWGVWLCPSAAACSHLSKLQSTPQ